MISIDYARRLLLECTAQCPVPIAPDWLSRYTFQAGDYVIVGDTTVRGYKYNNRWRLDEREVRAAAAHLVSLPVGLDDPVDAELPMDGDHSSWRSRIRSWLDDAAYRHQSRHGCTCTGRQPCDRVRPNGDGLGCAMSRAEAEQFLGRRALAATLPWPLLAWSGTAWTLPRGYAALLDRADALAARCVTTSGACSRCRTVGQAGQLRTASPAGYVTLCPACATDVARPYRDHLRGRRYTSLPVYARAEGFLCRLCPVPRPALYWDHCHEHGLVRGPVCASCNAYEGGGARFLDRPGAMRHLLQCEGCLQDRTVPPRHQPDIVLRTFVFAPHGACPRPPDRAFGTVEADGSVRFRLSCWQHPAQQAWDQVVPASQVRELVQAFVDAAVTGLDGDGDGDRPTG